MRRIISDRKLQTRPPAALLDERGTLVMFGWIVGCIVVGCFALSAVALTLEPVPGVYASLPVAVR